ncbi:hypothetical protein Q2941_41390 [Bradyrhizobium sp. UFLA05-153]
MKLLYCWRCQMEIPMLDEQESAYVLENGQDRPRILRRYFEITGFDETNANAVWHHPINLYGPPCVSCGKPLPTPQARLCAACGAEVVRA